MLCLVTQLCTACARKQQIYVQNSMEKLNGEIPVNKQQNDINRMS